MYLWINCIYVHKSEEGKWAATLIWDSKKENDSSISKRIRGDYKGEIQTQYFEDTLTLAIDMVLNLAKFMNININEELKPEIYYTNDDTLLERFPSSEEAEREIEEENKRRNWS